MTKSSSGGEIFVTGLPPTAVPSRPTSGSSRPAPAASALGRDRLGVWSEGADTIIALTIPQLGDLALNDLVQLELHDDPELGSVIDLSMAPNDNYATCDQCARLLDRERAEARCLEVLGQAAGTKQTS